MNWGYFIVFILVLYGTLGAIYSIIPSGDSEHMKEWTVYSWMNGEYDYDPDWNFYMAEHGDNKYTRGLTYPQRLSVNETVWVSGDIRIENSSFKWSTWTGPIWKDIIYDIKIRFYNANTGEITSTKTYDYVPELDYFNILEPVKYFHAEFNISGGLMPEWDYYFVVEAWERNHHKGTEYMKELYGGMITGETGYSGDLHTRDLTTTTDTGNAIFKFLNGYQRLGEDILDAPFPFNIFILAILFTPLGALRTYGIFYHARPGFWLFGGG